MVDKTALAAVSLLKLKRLRKASWIAPHLVASAAGMSTVMLESYELGERRCPLAIEQRLRATIARLARRGW